MPLINCIGGGGADLQSGKSVTPTKDSKTYYPENGCEGFSDFTVEGDSNHVDENIKDGVWLFGVLGKYTGKYHVCHAEDVVADDSYTNEFVVKISSPGWSVPSDSDVHYVFIISQNSQASGEVAFAYYDFIRQKGLAVTEEENGTGLYPIDSQAFENEDVWVSAHGVLSGTVMEFSFGMDVSSDSVFDGVSETTDKYTVYAIFGPASELP